MAFMIPAIPYIVMGLSAATGAYGAYSAGQAQKKVASANEDIAFQESQAILKSTQEKEAATRRKYEALMGEQRNLYAKAGVDIASGSPLEVLAQQAEDAEREALIIRDTGKTQAINMLNKGSIAGYQGEAAGEAGTIGAIGSIFNSAATAMTAGGRGKTGYWGWGRNA